jgi:hypothetical protein
MMNELEMAYDDPGIPRWPTDREEVLVWIEQGRNPLPNDLPPFYKIPFHQASKRKDLELLLHMVAEPGNAWTKRFLFCRNMVVAVPAKGRACISSLELFYRGCYFGPDGNSMEGLEVLMMYGYKLSERDKLRIFFDGFRMLDDDLTYSLKMVKFCLATTSSSLATRELSSEFGEKNPLKAMLENAAFVVPKWNSSVGNPLLERYLVELARVLLKAGANPNPHGSCPPLFGAICNRFKEMVKLLIDYDAGRMFLLY